MLDRIADKQDGLSALSASDSFRNPLLAEANRVSRDQSLDSVWIRSLLEYDESDVLGTKVGLLSPVVRRQVRSYNCRIACLRRDQLRIVPLVADTVRLRSFAAGAFYFQSIVADSVTATVALGESLSKELGEPIRVPSADFWHVVFGWPGGK